MSHMVRRHYNLPSFNALAAFEAAARHLSLTRAASELNVTPGAVSKQVKSLEEEIGKPLFVRLHRALQLTADGETVFKALRDSFERLAQCLQAICTPGKARPVLVGTTMAMAQLWLMPRLGDFWKAHNGIVIDHMISDRVHDLQRTDIDLRIRYGDGAWPDEEAVKLFDDEIVPVASPGFAATNRIIKPQELAALPLLSVEGVDWTWTNWPDFFAEAGVAHRKLQVRRFNSYVIALQAALDGQGVTLGWMRLVGPLLIRRKLVRLTAARMPAPHCYYITWSARRPLAPEAATLRDWLLQSAS